MKRRLAAGWPVAVLIAVPLVTWWPATRGTVMFGGGDALVIFLPLRVFAAEAWRAGELPLWNEWVFSGFPLLGAMVVGALYPLTLLFLVLPPLAALTWAGLATLALCGVTTYAYVRAVGGTRAGALLAGLTFAGSGFIIARLANTPVLHAAPWLPLLLLALERLRAQPRLRWVFTAAAALALALLAGHPQVPAYTLGVGAAYAVWRAAVAAPVGRGRYLCLAALGLGGGLALAAPLLLPAAELAGQSVRDHLPYEAFVELALPPSRLSTLLFPLLDAGTQASRADIPYAGVLEQAGYVGVAGLMLALAAGGAWRRVPVVGFWLLVAALSLLMVLGDATPLGRLAFHLPVYNLFRICARNFFQFDLAVAVLAGLTLSGLQRGVGRSAVVTVAAVVMAAMLAIAASSAAPRLLLIVPLVLGALSLLLLLALARRPARAVVGLLVALQAVDLFLYAHGVQQEFPLAREALAAPPWLAPLRAVAGADRAVQVAAANVIPVDCRSALGGQRLIQGYDSLLIRRYAQFAGDMDYAGRISEAELVGAPLFLDLLTTRAALVVFTDRVQGRIAAAETAFAYPELGVSLAPGESIAFTLPAARVVRSVAVMSFLGGAIGIDQDEPVARITVRDAAGGAQSGELRAGAHTAEWAWDRADVAAVVRHRRAPIAEPFPMPGGREGMGNKYVGIVTLPAPVEAVRVEVQSVARQAVLQLSRISLLDPPGEPSPLSLAHLLLERPERWARRVSLSYPLRPDTAPALLGGAWLQGVLGVARGPTRPSVVHAEVLENLHVLPAAWFVPRTLAVDEATALASVRTARLPDGAPFDPRAVALVEQAPGRDFGPGDPSATAVVVARAPQRLVLATRSAAPGFLVVSELAYPGWTAEVDGAPVSILRTNGMLRGLALAAGAHRVEFVYRPLSVRLGLALAGATLLAFAAAGVWGAARRRSLSRMTGGRGRG